MVKIKGLVSALALGFGAVALSRMIFKKEKVETAVKKTIETPVKVAEKVVEVVGDSANEVKKVSKRLIKGSPEAKERMAKMRASPNFKRKRGTGKRAMAKKLSLAKVNDFIKDEVKGAKEYTETGLNDLASDEKSHAKKLKKIKAGKLGGQATARLGNHKGHKSKRGLAQDQKKESSETWEQRYQKERN